LLRFAGLSGPVFFCGKIELMVITILVLLGIIFGSFVSALVWRLRQQELNSAKVIPAKDPRSVILNKVKDLFVIVTNRSFGRPQDDRTGKSKLLSTLNSQLSTHDQYSILTGRSMCPNCHHELSAKDLIPIFSWLMLGGKCRYCHKPISAQYPIVELVTGLLFVTSYIYWPMSLVGRPHQAIFALWLAMLVGFVALTIYDLRWMLLPNRLVYPLAVLASVFSVISIAGATNHVDAFLNNLLAVIVGGGIFYVLFQVSAGKWIGGGDVKLGWLLGLILTTPGKAVLMIFVASLLGTLFSLPLLMSGKLKQHSIIPFGPFLIVAAYIVMLFGQNIIHWYTRSLLITGN
jgi:prepilin signal peptidase PulO-like enzyme (type II secretory pathway)